MTTSATLLILVLWARFAPATVPVDPVHRHASAPRFFSKTSTFDYLATADTGKTHGSLRRDIRTFQDEWRALWRASHNDIHSPFNLVDIRYRVASGIPNVEVERYLAIKCFINSPTDSAFNAVGSNENLFATGMRGGDGKRPTSLAAVNDPVALSIATSRQITPRPNTGPICPMWIPQEAGIPPDEGEAIDLALTEERRDTARRLRETLLQKLDAAQQREPADAWIAGQRVRFVYDQRDPQRTIATAQSCKGDESLCASLRGWAFEQAGQIADAEREFRRADSLKLAAASTAKKCLDQDVMWIIRARDRSDFDNEPCERQREFVERMWWLSDPLWSVPGNERYVAHGSRLVSATVHAVNDRDERYSWSDKQGGKAMRELVVRYGWPSYTFWGGFYVDEDINRFIDRLRFPPRFIAPPYTTREYAADRTALVPSVNGILYPFELKDADYYMYRPADRIHWWPSEHMSYLTHLARMDAGQDAQWRRDTSITYQLTIDDPLRNLDTASTSASAAILMAGESATTTRELARTAIAQGLTLRLRAQIPSKPVVLSAEILPRTLRDTARRLRFGLKPPPTLREMKRDDVALSDPVFMRMPNRTMTVPTDEASVLRYMAGDLAFSNREPLAIYWESYGFIPGDTIQFQLTFKRAGDVGAVRSVASALGVAGSGRDSISIRWTEPDASRATNVLRAAMPTVGRALAIDLTALEPGAYELAMEMRKGSSQSARSTRRFSIIPEPR